MSFVALLNHGPVYDPANICMAFHIAGVPLNFYLLAVFLCGAMGTDCHSWKKIGAIKNDDLTPLVNPIRIVLGESNET